jgi:REP element-mobilizing transposase RayT
MTGDIPLAYFITWTCYGTWLHGRGPGSVDGEHNRFGDPVLPPDPEREAEMRRQLVEPRYSLDRPQRQVVLRTIQEVSNHRRWCLLAAHVRSNHLHVITHAECGPDKVMEDYKAYSTRRLREAGFEPARRHRWTEGGSKRYLWKPEQLEAPIRYVVDEQGERMEVFVLADRVLREFLSL